MAHLKTIFIIIIHPTSRVFKQLVVCNVIWS